MRVPVTIIVAAVGAGIAACPGGDGEPSLGPAVAAPRLDRPELVVWRSSQLVRARADGRTVRVLVGDPSGEGFVATQWEPAAWSPDGRRLAFTAQVAGVLGDTNIHAMRADGSRRRKLTSDGISFHPVWSPDGKRIYYARRPERHPEEITLSDGRLEVPQWIWSMRPDGSDRRAFTEPVKGRYELPGSFAPDGTLAFTRGKYVELDEEGRERNTREVWTMRPDGSDARKLAERAQDPAFSSDGRRIAFASDRDANGSLSYGDKAFFANELYIMDADGGRQRRLTRTRDLNELQPSWMPGGADRLPARRRLPERRGNHRHAGERGRELPAAGARRAAAWALVRGAGLAAGRRTQRGPCASVLIKSAPAAPRPPGRCVRPPPPAPRSDHTDCCFAMADQSSEEPAPMQLVLLHRNRAAGSRRAVASASQRSPRDHSRP